MVSAPMTQREKAEIFRAYHTQPPILVLANAWDAASARIVEAAGYRAVATSSASLAWALGYSDGESAPRDEVLAAVHRITRVVNIPVTVDFVSGYGRTPDEVHGSIAALLSTGAVGLNIEDSRQGGPRPLYSIEEQVERIKSVRAAGDAASVPIVINARTDAYRRLAAGEHERLDESIRRLNAYREAGADCLFMLGTHDAATIERLVREVPGPINVLANPGLPAVPELAALGVARVSTGGGPGAAAYGLLRRVANELAEQGTYSAIAEFAISHDDMDRLFES